MKKKKLLLAAAALFLSAAVHAQDARMEAFIDNLMSKMTLREKIGQLNLPVTGEIVTGEAKSSDVAERLSVARWAASST